MTVMTVEMNDMEINDMEMLRENLKLMNLRVEKMEKMIKKLLDIEEENENEIDLSYTPSSNESVESLEFKEFSDEDIWETNKNENKECNECGSMDIEKDDLCEGDKYVFWCNECNSHVGASINENEIDDYEWCDECERVECKCNKNDCEGCRNDYLNQLGHMEPGGCLYEELIYRKRNLDEIDDEIDNEIDFKRNKHF